MAPVLFIVKLSSAQRDVACWESGRNERGVRALNPFWSGLTS